MTASNRGVLIVVEGLDRAGKSTQCERLCSSLQDEGRNVKHMRFPDRTTSIGKSIDSYLRGESDVEDHAIHLLFSANRWEAAARIRSDIEQGLDVVVDRYSFSGATYSAAKDNPELSLEWAWQPEIGLPQPDLLLFLVTSPGVAAQRRGFGLERYETDHMQARVRESFHELMRKLPGEYVRTVDADQSINEVEQDVLATVRRFLVSKKTHEPLRSLGPLG